MRNASVDFKCLLMAVRPNLRETKLPGSTRRSLFAAEMCLKLTLNAQKWQLGLTWGRQNFQAVLGADCLLLRNASVDFKCPEMAVMPYLSETKLPGSTLSWLFAAEKFFSWLSLPSAGGSNVSWFRSKFKLTSPCHYTISFNSIVS